MRSLTCYSLTSLVTMTHYFSILVMLQEGNLTLLEGGGGDYTRVGYSKNPYGTGVSQSGGGGAGYDQYGTNRSREGPYADVCITTLPPPLIIISLAEPIDVLEIVRDPTQIGRASCRERV